MLHKKRPVNYALYSNAKFPRSAQNHSYKWYTHVPTMSLPPHGRYSTRPSSLTVLRLAADRLDVAKLHVANTELEVESVLGRAYRASDMPLDIPLHKDTSDRLSHCLASTEAIDNPNAPVR